MATLPPHPITDLPTPEVAAYHAQKDVTEKSRIRIWHRVAFCLSLSLAVSVGTNVYNAALVHEIRTTQIHNTRIAQCETTSFNAILKDARLAFAGDKKKNDYSKAPRVC